MTTDDTEKAKADERIKKAEKERDIAIREKDGFIAKEYSVKVVCDGCNNACLPMSMRCCAHCRNELTEARDKAVADLSDLQATFDLRWKAAIAKWRAEKPVERDLTWPDHADLVVWLAGRYESLRHAAVAYLKARRYIDSGSPFDELAALKHLRELLGDAT